MWVLFQVFSTQKNDSFLCFCYLGDTFLPPKTVLSLIHIRLLYYIILQSHKDIYCSKIGRVLISFTSLFKSFSEKSNSQCMKSAQRGKHDILLSRVLLAAALKNCIRVNAIASWLLRTFWCCIKNRVNPFWLHIPWDRIHFQLEQFALVLSKLIFKYFITEYFITSF